MEILKLHGKSYAIGVIWQVASSNTLSKEELASMSEDAGQNLYVCRSTNPEQVCFSNTSDTPGKVYALTAIISKTIEVDGLPSSALCIFRLPERNDYLLFVQRNGFVDPRYCDFIGSKEEVSNKLIQIMDGCEWGLLVAPEDWMIGGSVFRSLEYFLPHDAANKVTVHDWSLFRKVGGIQITLRHKVLAGLVVAGILGGMAGWQRYAAYIERMKTEEAQRQLQEEEARRQAELAAMIARAPKELPRPWLSRPGASSVWNTCQEEAENLPLFAAGWALQSVQCTLDGRSVVIKTDYARGAAGLTYDALQSIWPDITFSDAARTQASRQWATQAVCCEREAAEGVMSVPEFMDDMLRTTQRAQRAVWWRDVPPVVPPPENPLLPTPVAKWMEYEFTAGSAEEPASVFMKTYGRRGMVIEKMNFTPTGGWQIQGRFYAKTD